GEHQVRAAGAQFVGGKLQGVQRRRARRVEGVPAAAETQDVRQHAGGQSGDEAIERIGRRGEIRQAEPPGKSAPKRLDGQGRGLLGRQRDVAEDDADAAAVQARRRRLRERLPACVDDQVKNRVKSRQHVIGRGRNLVEIVRARRVYAVRDRDTRRKRILRR